ncbi:hypothetical protein BGZ65_010997, partial [Modicella reniformis]
SQVIERRNTIVLTQNSVGAMASATAGASTGKPTGFMSEYMSDLNQSQDLNAFLRENQPAYNPNTHSTSSGVSVAITADSSSTSSTSSTSTSSSSKSSTFPGSDTREPNDPQNPMEAFRQSSAHLAYQRQAIQHAALDNCVDLNMGLTDCLMGRSGTWWDRASMCMKAKQRLQKCCQLNKDVLQERGFAAEGNTPEQDQAIQDFADEYVQKAMKEDRT